jgi:general secretion pathway protein J
MQPRPFQPDHDNCRTAACARQRVPVRHHHAGFTLIEVLVVLIIVGMVSGILFQALERAYRLQERFGIELFDVQQRQMAADWYRQTVQGLQPDYPDGRNKFQGGAHEFSGLTSNPLRFDQGGATAITWEIRTNPNGTTALIYRENNRESTIMNWQGAEAHFVYLDEVQVKHTSWPPPLGKSRQLPRMIMVEASDAGDPVSIVASVMGPIMPLPRLQDM